MMRKISWIGKVVLIVTAVFLTACDDGQLRLNQTDFSISPAAPTIIRFDAEPNNVDAGGSSTITWEVSNADSIEITSKADDGSSPLHVQTIENSGSAVAQSITADTEFTITATYSGPVEESEEDPLQDPKEVTINSYPPSGAEEEAVEGDELAPDSSTAAPPATKTIKVTVNMTSELSASIQADSTNLAAGDSTIIRWSVTSENAVIEVLDNDGIVVEPTFAGADCDITDPSELLELGTAAEAPQANGCAVVTPFNPNTIYTLTATEGDEAPARDDVEIFVNNADIAAEIRVNGVKDAKVNNFDEQVEVSWIVDPVGAVVTVTANPADSVVSCTPELPQGQVIDYSTSQCTLSGETEFSIRVAMTADDTDYVEDFANIALGSVNAGIDIRGDEWAFAGEEVTIEVKAKEGVSQSAIKEIHITDAIAGLRVIPFPISNPMLKVVVPQLGINVKMVDATDQETDYGTRVRALTTIEDNVTSQAEAITELIFDPNNVQSRFVGVQMPGFNAGKARIYKNGADIDVDFGTVLKAYQGLDAFWQDTVLDAKVKTFPVNSIAVRPGNSDEIYVGTTGAVVVSTDGGTSFELSAPALRISSDGKNYDGSHPSCRGLEQTGVKASHKHQVVSLNQICDIAIGANGRFIVGTDDGAFSIKSIDAFRAGEEGAKVVGHPSDKDNADAEGFLSYNHVVDDLECIDTDCNKVFAATDRGVLVSENGGETWSDFGGLSSRPYKIEHLGQILYAATESGVYESDVSSASWESMGIDYATKSIAIDPNEGQFGRMIIASTDQGVFVTRDSGDNWSTIEASGTEPSRDVAISTMPAKSGGGKLVTVMLGSGKKAIYGQTLVNLVSDGAAEEESMSDEEMAEMLEAAGADQAIVDALKGK
ncbi:MAG: hypothetical protein HN337_08560 [Deltaproteobacteria bacterium]|jgi:hypothetical protein|nr:hypothetical protein [Deltaproteobacteria bacterium]